MKISSISIRNFKRFSNLFIRDIPKEAKLVLLVGPNGAGKSCLFDALIQWYRNRVGFGVDNDVTYFRPSDQVAKSIGIAKEGQVRMNLCPKKREERFGDWNDAIYRPVFDCGYHRG
jgi:predicted ATP-binding protein involved in virulence